MLNGWLGDYVFVMVGVEEVSMVGEPAYPKDNHHSDEHLHQLKEVKCKIQILHFWLC